MLFIGIGSFILDFGLLLLIISLIAFIIDALMILLGEHLERWEEISELSLIIGSSAFFVSFLYFGLSIISGDYNFVYVSAYVNNSMDLFLRISVLWSGQTGSYFFWCFLALISYLIFRKTFSQYSHETFFWKSFLLVSFNVIVLTVLTLMNDPFKLNAFSPEDGIGLDPVLMNVWNFIHPPIIFIGYVSCLIPMAIAIAKISIMDENGEVPVFEGKEKLEAFFEFSLSLAWLILSSGIVIGAYWAYITLGWGGFWAWDPVETASLVPWLFLTLYYHGKPFHKKNAFLGNYIVSMTYIGTMFATYLTRSGIITSVHTFQPLATLESFLLNFLPHDSFLTTIILRFLPNEKIFVLFIVLVFLFLLPHIYGLKNGRLKQLPFVLSKDDFQLKKASVTSLKISYISFFIGTYVLILGLMSPVIYDVLGYLINFNSTGFGSGIIVGQIFFNTILAFFGGIMLIAQFFCVFYPKLSLKSKTRLLSLGLITGVLFSLSGILHRNGFFEEILPNNPFVNFMANFWTTSDKANLTIPLLLIGIVSLIFEFVRITLQEEKHLLRKSSQTMLHLSIIVIILGAVTSGNMSISNEFVVQEGNQYPVPGTSIVVQCMDLDRDNPTSGINVVNYDTTLLITSGGKVIGFIICRLGFDKINRPNQQVTIVSDFLADIYVVTTGIFEDSISGRFNAAVITIKIIPYINILWIGCLLLHFAIIPLTIGRFVILNKALKNDQYSETDDLTEKELQNGGGEDG